MINEKIAWLEENVDADAEELKAQKKEMEDVVQPIIAKLYQVLMTLFWEVFFSSQRVPFQGQGSAPPGDEGGDEDEEFKDELWSTITQGYQLPSFQCLKTNSPALWLFLSV